MFVKISMQVLLLLLALPILAAQEKPFLDEIRAIVEKLGAESLQERELATRRLLDLGPRSKNELQRLAAREPDAEVRGRIHGVLSKFRFLALKETRVLKIGAFGGHLGTESCLFSPDGTLLVTSGSDGKVKFLRVPGFTEVASFDLPVDSFSSVLGSFSRDGKLLLVGDRGGYLNLIDVPQRKIKSRVRMSSHDRTVVCALSPDGRFAAGKSYNGSVNFWDTTTAKAIRAPGETDIAGYGAPLLFSPKSRYLAYRAKRGEVHVYDTSVGRLHSRFAKNTTNVIGAGGEIWFTPDEKRIIAGDRTGQLLVLSLETNKVERTFEAVRRHVLSGTTLVMRGSSGRLAVCDLDRDEKEQELGHSRIREPALLRDGKYVFGSPGDIFDLKRRRQVATLEVPGKPLWADEKWKRAVVRRGSTLLIWDVGERRAISELGHESHGPVVSFSPNGNLLACATLDGRLRIVELPGGKQSTYEPHGGAIRTIGLSPGGGRLATGGYDGAVRVWDVSTGRLLKTLSKPWSSVAQIVFSPDGRWMVATGYGKHWGGTLFELESRDSWDLSHAGETPQTTVFSSDSRYLVVGSHKSRYVWDCRAGKKVFEKKGDLRWPGACTGDTFVTCTGGACSVLSLPNLAQVESLPMTSVGSCERVNISGDGRYVAAVSRVWRGPPVYHLWDLKDKRLIHAESGDEDTWDAGGTFGPLAFSPDGRQVAVVSTDQEYRARLAIRESATWRIVAPLHPSNPLAYGAIPYFRPSGRSLLTIGEKGELEVWHYESSRLRSAVSLALEESYEHKISRDASVIAGITGPEAVVWRLAPGRR